MTSKYETMDEEDEPEGLIAFVKNALLEPFRVVFSTTAKRAYLTTFLIVSTATILLGFAITAYVLFYWSYVPRIGFERTIHLQFDNVYKPADARHGVERGANPYPYGNVVLAPDVVSMQKYDIAIELRLPRTRENRDAGNFMLDVTLSLSEEKATGVVDTVKDGMSSRSADTAPALARSRRSAMLSYRSIVVEYCYRLTELHWYLLNWRQEAEELHISVFEGIAFQKGWRNVPATLKLEVQSTHRMQIYGAKAIFRARFQGLRWLMYNHRIISAIVFIGGFWTTEMIFAGLAWAALAMVFRPPPQAIKAEQMHEAAKHIKHEDNEEMEHKLSDTERTFPTTSGQRPLRYRSPEVKQEENIVLLQDVPIKGVEADDEDEDADFFLDSGLGTSMESSASRRENMRKKRGRMSSRESG